MTVTVLRAGIWLFAICACLFLVLASLIVIPMSFNADDFLRFPPRDYSLIWYKAYLNSPDWQHATMNSLTIAVVTTALATVWTLVSYGLIRGRVPLRNMVIVTLLTPMITPSIVTAVALYLTFAPLGLVGTIPGMVIAHTVLVLPVVILNISAVMQRMDWRLERAARSLGASPTAAFIRVVLPLLAPGIIAGAVFAFMMSFEEVVVSNYMYGSRLETLPIKMWSGLQLELNPIVASVSTLLIAVSGVGFAILMAFRRGSA